MSVHRLYLEQDLRQAEAEREAEELRKAQQLRAELHLPEPGRLAVRRVLLPAEPGPFDDAAMRIQRWWNGRSKRGAVTNSEIAHLVRNIRGMGRGRR